MSANDDGIKAGPTGVADVLANDSSSPSQPFTIVSNTQPANGTVSCSTLGACFYRANPGFTGSDAFTYTARNEGGAEDTATVNVGVGASTASPALIARDDDLATLKDNAKSLNVMANDTGTDITLVDNGDPQHGTATCQSDGTCTYTPNAGYTGSDGFVYTIAESGGSQLSRQALGQSGSGRTASAAVHILVAPGDTGYRLSVSGAPQNPSNGAIPSGGKANWALGVIAVPAGISGQELAAIGRPSGSAGLSGPHGLESGSLTTAKGWSANVGGDGRVNYSAGDGALLGESHTQTFPKPLPPISQGTGGDGHVPILLGTKVFAFYHHTHPTSATCVDRQTGAVCPGYPKQLSNIGSEGFHSTDNNGPGVVQGTKIWTHLYVPATQRASVGLFCWDESTDSTCGYTIVARPASSFMDASAPVRGADGNAWFASGDTAYCVEPGSGATCGSVAIPLPATSSAMDAISHGQFAYFSRENEPGQGQPQERVTCVDTSTRALCAGWSQGQNFGPGQWNLVNRHGTDGATNGICVFAGQTGDCMPDGDPAAATSVDNFVHFDTHYSGSLEAEFGTRTLVGSLGPQGAGCYDWSVPAGTNPGSPCTGGGYGNGGTPGWISRQSDGSSFPRSGAYGIISDGSCAIALGDAGQVYTVDPAGAAPCVSLGSGTDRTTIDLRDQRCDRSVGGAAWRNVVLSDTNGDEMESVVVTVRDAQSGQVLKSGQMIGGDQTLDLSGISAADHPSITIDATARSKGGNGAWDDGIPPRLKVNWKSDPKTACLTSQGDNACAPSAATVTVAGTLANGSGSEAHLSLLRKACGGVLGQQARSCGSKRRVLMTLRIERHLRKLKAKKSQVKSVRVVVNGKRAKVFKRNGRWKARADLRRLKKGRYVVRITVKLKDGREITGVRRYRTCRDAIAGGPPRL